MLDDGAVDCVFKGGGAAGRRSRFRDEGFEDGILAIEGLVIVHPQVCCFSAAGKSVYAYDDCSIPRFRLGVFIEVGTSKCILTRLFNQFSVDRPFQTSTANAWWVKIQPTHITCDLSQSRVGNGLRKSINQLNPSSFGSTIKPTGVAIFAFSSLYDVIG